MAKSFVLSFPIDRRPTRPIRTVNKAPGSLERDLRNGISFFAVFGAKKRSKRREKKYLRDQLLISDNFCPKLFFVGRIFKKPHKSPCLRVFSSKKLHRDPTPEPFLV
jgi:hypothetical protein